MDLVLEYVGLGIASVFQTAEGGFWLLPLLMVLIGVVVGILIGATPGMSGPFAMAIALPVEMPPAASANDKVPEPLVLRT